MGKTERGEDVRVPVGTKSDVGYECYRAKRFGGIQERIRVQLPTSPLLRGTVGSVEPA